MNEKLIKRVGEAADNMDKCGFTKIAESLDSVMHSVMFDGYEKYVMSKTAGEKMDFKEWEIHSEALQAPDWALNVSRGEENEQDDPILVKVQNGIMTIRYQNDYYKSGIQFKSDYFYSDKFKNSIARAFRGLQTGKVSFTHVKEMYDLNKTKSKDKKVEPSDDLETK